MGSAGTVLVDFEGNFGRLSSGLDAFVSTGAGKFLKLEELSKSSFARIGVAVGAIGLGLFAVGKAFDDAYDTIRVGTGATGEALDGLKDDFKAVVRDVPADFGSASTAVADLNTRLGLTGTTLQGSAKQFLELSRITGTDLASNIESVTRVFGDWGIATKDQEAALDKLFRASQASGVSVQRIGENAVKYGAPLRQLGFSFEEAAAMVAKFEKEGVNTELVMGSMRIALGKMAREGEPAVETFQRLVEQIKNAGSASEANALALELFGARAGPDMAAAIREGRFELDDMLTVIAGGSDTIIKAGQDTQDFGEKWQMVKNQALLAFEPIASRVFDWTGKLASGFLAIPDWGQTFLIGGAAAALAVKPIMGMVHGIGSFVQGIGPAIQGIGAFGSKLGAMAMSAGPVILALGLIAGAAYGVKQALDGSAGTWHSATTQLSRMTDAQLANFAATTSSKMGLQGYSTWLKTVAGDSITLAQAMVDGSNFHGAARQKLQRIVDEEAAAQSRSAQRTQENTAAIAGLAGQAGAADMEIGQLRDQLDLLTSASFDVEGSAIRMEQSIANLAEAVRGGKQDTLEGRQAFLDAKQSIVEWGSAVEEESLAAGDSTATASQKQIDALSYVANTLDPGSPLRVFLDQYIWKLATIPPDANTTVTAHDAASPVLDRIIGKLRTIGQGAGATIRAVGAAVAEPRALGGPVRAGELYQVNENELEFFRPHLGGEVIPLSKMAGSGSQRAAARTATVHVENLTMVYEGHDPDEFFDRVAAAVS